MHIYVAFLAIHGRYRDPARGVGSQSETPTFTAHKDGSVEVDGYQRFEISAIGEVTVHKKAEKFQKLKEIFVELSRDHVVQTLIDVGCNTGLASFLAFEAGYTKVMGLDLDPANVYVFNGVATARNAHKGLMAKNFTFGDPLPFVADVINVGALTHWVWCLTSEVHKIGFEGLLRYLFKYTKSFVVIEFVLPTDGAVRRFGHLRRCGNKTAQAMYTVDNFERAVSQVAKIMKKIEIDGPSRLLYVLDKTVPVDLVCARTAEEMVREHELGPVIPPLRRCQGSVLYVDEQRTLALKHYQLRDRIEDGRFIEGSHDRYKILEREACTLLALQRFSWTPNLLCVGEDYILTEHAGEPACADHEPYNYKEQLERIFDDMQALKLRHNDLQKPYATDFVVGLYGDVKLLDYGWASINGSLEINCMWNDTVLIANDVEPPQFPSMRRGFRAAETVDSLPPLPRCAPPPRPDWDASFVRPYATQQECQRQSRPRSRSIS